MKNKLIEIDRKREEETLNCFNSMRDDLTEYLDYELSKSKAVRFYWGLGHGLCLSVDILGIDKRYNGYSHLKDHQKNKLDHMLKNHLKKQGYYVSRDPTRDTRIVRQTTANQILATACSAVAVLLLALLWILL